ncbi:MAG TPA: proton-conducting transporter membrane subunit [Actinomycetota bacterium]
MLWLAPLAPLAVAGLAAAARAGWAPWVAGGGVVVSLVGSLMGAAGEWTASWGWGPALGLSLSADGIARVVAVLVPAVALPVLAYAASDHRGDPGRRRLLSLLALFVGAMQMVVLAADLLTLLIGWELVAACSWALIGHRWREDAPRAGQEAFVVTRVGAVGLVVAAGAALHATGSLRFEDLGGATAVDLHLIAAGVLAAALAKSAQPPFSPWLFSAMAGPTSVSALLHSATMVAAGAYALARLAPALEPTGWFGPAVIGFGLAGALLGGIVALLQSDVKRALAASTTAQYGLVLVAVGALAVPATAGHLAAHAVAKASLFLAAGVAIHAAGSGDLTRMRLGRALPAIAWLFAVGAASLAGVPPLGGAFTKDAVIGAAWEHATWAGVGALLAGALSALYAGRIALLAYGPGEARRPAAPPALQRAAIAVLTLLVVLLGLLWLPPVREGLAGIVGGDAVVPAAWEILLSVGAIVLAAVIVLLLDRRRALASLGLPDRLRFPAADWLGLPAAGRVLVVTPVLALSRGLARLDDSVVDAGVRAVGRVADLFARVFRAWGERGVDGLVEGVGRGTLASADGSRRVDEGLVDGSVEGVARGVGAAGAASRLLQSGLAHRYYVIIAVGLAVAAAVAFLVR